MKLLAPSFALAVFGASAQHNKPAGPVSTSIGIEGAVIRSEIFVKWLRTLQVRKIVD